MSVASFLFWPVVVGWVGDVALVNSDFWKATASVHDCRFGLLSHMHLFTSKAVETTTINAVLSTLSNMASVVMAFRGPGVYVGLWVMLPWISVKTSSVLDDFSVALSAVEGLIRVVAVVVTTASKPSCLMFPSNLVISVLLSWCELQVVADPRGLDTERFWDRHHTACSRIASRVPVL